MESDENLSMNSSVKARLSPPMPQTAIGSPMPIPTERQSLVKREEMMMNGGGAKMDQKKSKSEQHLDKSTTTNGMKQSAGEDVDEEEEEYEEEDEEEAELEDESEWTEVVSFSPSVCSAPPPQKNPSLLFIFDNHCTFPEPLKISCILCRHRPH
jgi:hypothetical protein